MVPLRDIAQIESSVVAPVGHARTWGLPGLAVTAEGDIGSEYHGIFFPSIPLIYTFSLALELDLKLDSAPAPPLPMSQQ